MKLRISSSDKTAFWKDITRFAPAWALYTVCYVIGFLLLRNDGNSYWYIRNISDLIRISPLINIAYAFLVAQLLFGDLYNARMCNVLHALPIRREKWFMSHVASGWLFAAVPCIIGCVLSMVLSIGTRVENGWMVCLYWLGGTLLQFTCFYGIAVLSSVAVGNRFAMLVVCGIVNFFSILVYCLVVTLYIPLLYGIDIQEKGFTTFAPMVRMMNRSDYISVQRNTDEFGNIIRAWFEVGEGWGYLFICAGVGLALLGISCLLYKKRHMESAGDFMAFRCVEPVFQIIYTVCVGIMFHFVSFNMFGLRSNWIMLAAGLVIGFFTGRMLLERQTRVFRKKSFLGCAALLAVMALSIVVVHLDPLGLETWVPEKDQVEKVGVSTGWYYNDAADWSGEVILDEPQEIDDILAVHEYVLAHSNLKRGTVIATVEVPEGAYKSSTSITINYFLKNGTCRQRYYQIFNDEEAAQILAPYFSTMEYHFGEDTDPASLAAKLEIMTVDNGGQNSVHITDKAEIRSFLEAVEKDCEAGVMTPNGRFKAKESLTWCWVTLQSGYEENYGYRSYYDLTIYEDCVNAVAWLEAYGVESEYALRREGVGEVTFIGK